MSWTIKRISDGKYLYSSFAFVNERIFAKRFNTEKQAKACARESGLHRNECIAEELSDESADMLKCELNNIIQRKFYTK